MSQLLRVQNFGVSIDGFGAGDGQRLERPFGHANPADFFAWAFDTASFHYRSEPGGSRGLEDYFSRDYAHNIGAEIMGRNKFGPHRGPWENHDWTGWWGDTPPFHTPVFVLTHHPRPPAKRCGRPERPPTGTMCGEEAASPPFGSSSTPTSSTRCISPSRRSSSAAANDSGTPPTTCSTGSISNPYPARVAVSPTTCSGAGPADEPLAGPTATDARYGKGPSGEGL
jgi:hypothetical protein